jgi:hypothetical protein
MSQGMAGHNYSMILLLSFVCAFSLESIAATILVALVAMWVVVATISLYQTRTAGHAKIHLIPSRLLFFAYSSLGAFFFCVASLLIAMMFSGRVAESSQSDFVDNLAKLQFSLIKESEPIRLVAAHGKSILVIVVLTFGIVFFQFAKNICKRSALASVLKLPRLSRQQYAFCLSTIIVSASSFLVTTAISARSGTNYFSHANYPWGDLLLTAKLFLMLFAFMVLSGIPASFFGTRSISVLLMFVIASKYTLGFVNASKEGYKNSILVEKSYRAATVIHSDTIESGLRLESIPMQVRPLPTKDSPDWFVEAYKRMFVKYYDINDIRFFR